MTDSEFEHRLLRLLIAHGEAFLLDPDGAKARWQRRVEDAFVEDPRAANEKYGRVLRWLTKEAQPMSAQQTEKCGRQMRLEKQTRPEGNP